MLHCSRCVLHSLPFVPMALSTLDTLEQRLEAVNLGTTPAATTKATSTASTMRLSTAFSIGGKTKADQLQWFSSQSPSPFFISPKHDGVRLISYVPPQSSMPPSALSGKRRSSTKKQQVFRTADGASCVAEKAATTHEPIMTCYSRYGRPIYGLFWIEEELQLLRVLCGDPSLIVDGELYLHQTHMDATASCAAATRRAESRSSVAPPASTTKKREERTRTRKRPLPAPGLGGDDKRSVADIAVSPAETFETGFLAVSALVHRLRGPSLRFATEQDILQYVPALPSLCVFDIPSYSPCSNPLSSLSTTSVTAWPQLASSVKLSGTVSLKEQRAVAVELQRVRRAVMTQLRIRDVEQLRVVPNTTPFSQRLRTMNFIFQLLQTAMASPVLRARFCPSQAAPTGSKTAKPAWKVPPARSMKDGTHNMPYHGGYFVCRIPYQLVASLEETTQRVLPAYIRQGFEGAVIRTPLNTYEFKEKRKGTLAALVASLLHADRATAASHRRTKKSLRTLRGKRDQAAFLLSLGGEKAASGGQTLMVRAYSHRTPSVEALTTVPTASAVLSEEEQDVLDAVAAGERAVQRAVQLRTRSETAVKVLAYHDREYAILRPLLKEPSTNPKTRVLVSIPRSAVSALGYPIKPDADTVAENDERDGENTASERKAPPKTSSKKKASKVDNTAAAASSSGSPVVVFYGLQCLAENGLVFNVTMPKLTLTQQKALLDHLLAAGANRTRGRSGAVQRKKKENYDDDVATSSERKMASLTGLYATVKFSSLTEHGLPRFGTVKAIRGGKGWFM